MAMKFTLPQVQPELAKVLDSNVPLATSFSVSELYFVMQACQLTATHPRLSPNMVDCFIALGRRAQELLRPHVSDFFAEFCEAGWNREYDETF